MNQVAGFEVLNLAGELPPAFGDSCAGNFDFDGLDNNFCPHALFVLHLDLFECLTDSRIRKLATILGALASNGSELGFKRVDSGLGDEVTRHVVILRSLELLILDRRSSLRWPSLHVYYKP